MQQEIFPELSTDLITVSVPYPGATPAEVEESVVVRIEEAIEDLQGIEKITSTANEGSARVRVEVAKGEGPRALLDEEPAFAAAFAACDAALAPHTGWSVRAVLDGARGAPRLDDIGADQTSADARSRLGCTNPHECRRYRGPMADEAHARIHLVVLFGGESAEHDVSCTTAAHVLRAADPEREFDTTNHRATARLAQQADAAGELAQGSEARWSRSWR